MGYCQFSACDEPVVQVEHQKSPVCAGLAGLVEKGGSLHLQPADLEDVRGALVWVDLHEVA